MKMMFGRLPANDCCAIASDATKTSVQSPAIANMYRRKNACMISPDKDVPLGRFHQCVPAASMKGREKRVNRRLPTRGRGEGVVQATFAYSSGRRGHGG